MAHTKADFQGIYSRFLTAVERSEGAPQRRVAGSIPVSPALAKSEMKRIEMSWQ